MTCLQGPARQSGKSETTRRRGRLRLLRLRRPTAARGFEGAYTLTALSSVVYLCAGLMCVGLVTCGYNLFTKGVETFRRRQGRELADHSSLAARRGLTTMEAVWTKV